MIQDAFKIKLGNRSARKRVSGSGKIRMHQSLQVVSPTTSATRDSSYAVVLVFASFCSPRAGRASVGAMQLMCLCAYMQDVRMHAVDGMGGGLVKPSLAPNPYG